MFGRRRARRARQAEELAATREALEKLERDQAATERALRRSEERCQVLSELGGGYSYDFRFGPDGELTNDWSSHSGLEATGYTNEEIAALGWRGLIHPDDRPIGEARERALAAGQTTSAELRLVARTGEVVWVRDSVKPFRDEHGVLRILGVTKDITAHKQAEERERKAQQQLLHAQKLEYTGLLAAGIAHEFNNLLVGILGNAELLEADVEPGSMARVAVDQIRDAGSRAAGLTRQLLTFAGKDDASEETFDLSALVRGTSELMRSSVSRETDLVAEYATRPVWITADPGEMRQVVLNIVANAAEAYADRQGSVIVRTGIQKVDEQYLSECYLDSQLPLGHYGYVEVCDTGAGIADGDMERIFDPFFSTKFKGRGLGLAAVLGIVSRRHGTIRVESEPGSGTTMRILLPSVEPS